MTGDEKLLDVLKEAEGVQAQVFRDVEAAARTACSRTLATSSGETLDGFVRLWFGLERLSYESDEQLRERCEAKMRREFKS
jgi:hypothetical protein